MVKKILLLFTFLSGLHAYSILAQTIKFTEYSPGVTTDKQISLTPSTGMAERENIFNTNYDITLGTIVDMSQLSYSLKLVNGPTGSENYTTTTNAWSLQLVARNFEVPMANIINDDGTPTNDGLITPVNGGTKIDASIFQAVPANTWNPVLAYSDGNGNITTNFDYGLDKSFFIPYKESFSAGVPNYGWLKIDILFSYQTPNDQNTDIIEIQLFHLGSGTPVVSGTPLNAGQTINSLKVVYSKAPRADKVYEIELNKPSTNMTFEVTTDPANAILVEGILTVLGNPNNSPLSINTGETNGNKGSIEFANLGKETLIHQAAYSNLKAVNTFADMTTATINNFEVVAEVIPPTSVTISGSATINRAGGSVLLAETVLPTSATDKSVIWSVEPSATGNSIVTVDQNGLVKAKNTGNGVAEIKVVTTLGAKESVFTITVSNQDIPLRKITVTGPNKADGSTPDTSGIISTKGGTYTPMAKFEPLDAKNTSITWSFKQSTSGYIDATTTSLATIHPLTGIVTSTNKFNGDVTIIATSTQQGSTVVSNDFNIKIQGQDEAIAMSSFEIESVSNVNKYSSSITNPPANGKITIDEGGIQLKITSIMPIDDPATINNEGATEKDVTWFIGTKAEYDAAEAYKLANPGMTPPGNISTTYLKAVTDTGSFQAIGDHSGVIATVVAVADFALGSNQPAYKEFTIQIIGQQIPIPILPENSAAPADGSQVLTSNGLPFEITNPGGSLELQKLLKFDENVAKVSNDLPITTVTWTLGDQTDAAAAPSSTIPVSLATLTFADPGTNQRPIITAKNNFNGTVEVIMTSDALDSNDPPMPIVITKEITIKGQDVFIPLNSFDITNTAPIIDTKGGTVLLDVIFDPVDATRQKDGLTWVIVNPDMTETNRNALASLSTNGALTALNQGNGAVTVKVTATETLEEEKTKVSNDASLDAAAKQTAFDDLEAKYIKKITVNISNQETEIPIQGLKIVGSNSIAVIGGQTQLTVEPTPSTTTQTNFSFKILSGNDLATVNNMGVVKATDNGNGVVIVEVASVSNPAIKSQIGINISGQTISLQSMKVVTVGLVINMNVGQIVNLKVLGLPIEADQSFTWDIKTPDLIKISSGNFFEALKLGQAVIGAIPSDMSIISAAETLTINIVEKQEIPKDTGGSGGFGGSGGSSGTGGSSGGSSGTGGSSGGGNNNSSITALDESIYIKKPYPNPTNTVINFEVQPQLVDEAFAIYNAMGQQMYFSYTVQNNQIDVSNFKSGIYFVKIDNQDEVLSFIKN